MRRLARTLLGIAILRACLGAFILIALQAGIPHADILSLAAFALAQATDHLDGWIARKFSVPSTAGYLQDSVADKLFHAGCVLGLSAHHPILGVFLWGLLGREFILMAVRTLAPEVERTLSHLKGHSVAYAFVLRVGILVFLVGPLLQEDLRRTAIALGYTCFGGALLVGAVGLVACFKMRSAHASPQ